MGIPVVRFIFGGKSSDCAEMGRAYTLVYDGTCKVCGKLVKLLDRWDKRKQIEIVPSQNSCVPARFPWIPLTAYAEAVQLVGPGGATTSGASAIEELLSILPKGWLLGWVWKIPFMGTLIDRFYKWFARNRYKFGCGEHCQLKPQQLNFVE